MFKDIKVIPLVSILVAVVFIISSLGLFIALNNEKSGKVTLQEELAQVMKERKRLSNEVEELKLIKGDMEMKLGGLEAQTKLLTENYEKEKAQNDVVRSELSKKEKELDGIRSELGTIAGEKEKLLERLEDEKAKYGQLRERVDKLADVKGKLEEKVREIINKQGIELERIVVKAEGELEGRVLVVNREYNFAVVDIGARDNIELSDILTVFRKGKYMGEIQVEKIYDTMAAATIVKEIKSGAIMVDDNVIVRSD
jgi:predicted  nucleic acid-binding Zn-ribbon protein